VICGDSGSWSCIGVVVLEDDPPAASAPSLWAWAWECHHCQNQNQWGNRRLGLSVLGGFFFGFVFEIDNGPIHRISCSLKSKIVSDQYDGIVWWRGGANKAVHHFLLLNNEFQIGMKSTAFAQPLEYNVEQVVHDMLCDDFCCPQWT
jgi:hypothetical protein